jgi:hypothetical protein
MRWIAFLAIHNEEHNSASCIANLVHPGVEFCWIDKTLPFHRAWHSRTARFLIHRD